MTDPERRRRVEELCDSALDRDARERAAFVVAACGGDEALRQEVEALLAHAQAAEGFLVTPIGAVAANVLADAHGASLVGRQVGSYKVISLIGSGGMGDVYRARDTTLGRDVAIKVVADAFLSDPERLARFEREARVLATLNHPHIGAIYGLEEADPSPGSGQAAVRALVLELVEGKTLAERLAVGPVPIQEALTVARQIADALEAAHEKGIVHRDLKPGNIKITPDGTVKVLDFGLAKVGAGDGAPPDLSQAPTVSQGRTRDGVILGTAAYMSPEQARGQAIDKRTDIWAFGCVLYEMLTGRVPFAGDTTSDTIARVLERNPDWQALPEATPASVTRLLQRCLDKDPKRRLHDIADARIEIEDALSGTSFTATETAVVDPQRRPVRLPWSLAAIASLVALVAVGVLTWYVRTAPQTQTTPPRLSRLTMAISSAAAVTPGGGNERHLAITPDGTRVIYIGNASTQLFVRPLDRLDSAAIFTSMAPLNWVFVSPDGQWIGFAEGAFLKKVALTGGPAVTITPNNALGGATWAPDDTIIFSTPDPALGLQRVSAAGGDVTTLTRPAPARGERDHLWPEMLPGGRAVLFTITATTGGLDAAQVAVLDLAAGTLKVLVRGGSHAQYVPSGHLVYSAGGTLRAVPFDLTRLETSGTPMTVLPQPVTPLGAGDFVVAANGTLTYVDAPGGTRARTLVWVDRQGREEALAAPPRDYFHPRVSPDGTRVALTVNDQENFDIWVWDLARQMLSRLTFDPSYDYFPAWTPDGRRLVFASGTGLPRLVWQLADGTGAAEALGSVGLESSVTPDGARVIFSRQGQDLMMLALDGRRPQPGAGHAEPVEPGRVEPLVQTPFAERNGIVSPDGRWLAYESDSSGRFEIYVRPFPNVSAGQWLISTAGGTRPLWARNGQELFYAAPEGPLMAVPVDPRSGTWSAGSPAKVVEGPYLTGGGNSGRTYDVSTDGQRFLMIKQPANQAAPQIVVVQNWVEELKRLVPTK